MKIKEVVCNLEDVASLKDELFKIGSKEVSEDIFFSIKSRYKLLYVVSSEEDRVLSFIIKFCQSQAYTGFVWDCARGLLDITTNKVPATTEENPVVNSDDIKDPEVALSYILDGINIKTESNGRIYVLLDFHHFLQSDEVYKIERKLKHFSRLSKTDTIIIVAPEYSSTIGLDKEFTMIDFPYPSKDEIRQTLDKVKASVALTNPVIAKSASENEEEIIRAASGLTLAEARYALAKTAVKDKQFSITSLVKEKEQIIKKTKLLEYFEPKVSLDDVGGLETLKQWIKTRKSIFTEDARNFGIPNPKGLMLVGCSGAGKSFIAKAIASEYKHPLLRLDMGSMFDSLVGASEKRIRESLKLVDSLESCTLWIDEIEKGVSGIDSSSKSDGGTTARVVSTLLTWMQEKTSSAFIVATANNIHLMPPEMTRAGRFDEIFFVDLPSIVEREDIVNKLLIRKHRDPSKVDAKAVAEVCDGYVGAEIEKAIDNSIIMSYVDGKRDVRTEDIIKSLGEFIPLSVARKEEIESLRSWAKDGRAVYANAKIKPPMTLKKKEQKLTKSSVDGNESDILELDMK